MPKKRLNILYITQYFYPEIGATQTRALEMASNLVRQGHRVTVLTEFPNHPKGIIPKEYRGRFWEREKYREIHVVRTWVWTRPQKTFVTRMGFYLSFMATAAIAGLFIPGRFDVVYTTSPPFFVGVTGYWLSRIKNARFVFEVRDLWPRSAIELGELNNPAFIRWAEKLERFFYRKAMRIVTVTQGIQDVLAGRGYHPDKLCLVTNGTNTALFTNQGNAQKSRLALENKFVVLYAGILGIAQGIETLMDVVEALRKEDRIHFVFIGEGPVKEKIQAIQHNCALTNLTLMDEIPRDEIPVYISMADCCLVPLKKTDLFKGALPSKMFDYMACERPIIVSIDGEARRIVEASGGGVFVEPENVQQMIAAILKLKSTPALCEKMGKHGRVFVETHFSRRQKALELEKILLQLFHAKEANR